MTHSTGAVVVRVVDYGEADRVVTLISRDRGKLSAMARGARRSRRRFGAGLALFSVGRASLKERPGADLDAARVLEVLLGSLAPSDAAKLAAKITGQPRSELYRKALERGK